MLAIMVLGAASGFPNQVTESTLQAWLKDRARATPRSACCPTSRCPYLLKFLWAPLLDRYPLPFLGRRRGWMLVAQLAIAAMHRRARLAEPVAVAAAGHRLRGRHRVLLGLAGHRVRCLSHRRRQAARARCLRRLPTTSAIARPPGSAFAFALVLADFVGMAHRVVHARRHSWPPSSIATWLAPEPEYRHAPPRNAARVGARAAARAVRHARCRRRSSPSSCCSRSAMRSR